jgi:hypothetical protein
MAKLWRLAIAEPPEAASKKTVKCRIESGSNVLNMTGSTRRHDPHVLNRPVRRKRAYGA